MNSNVPKLNNAPKTPKPKKQKPKAKQTMNNRQSKAPVALGTVARVSRPNISHTKKGTCRVSHSELVGDVVGSDAFTVVSYAVNSGLASVFAWLSSLATNYESYKFRRLTFRYVTACATTQTGFIYLAMEYDPTDPVPTSEQQLATYDGCTFGSAWTNHTNSSSKLNLSKRSSYFVRAGTLATGVDLGLYDIGYLIIATVGNGGTPALGKLWVDYEVEFTTPQLGSIGIGKALSSSFVYTDFFSTAPTKLGNSPLTATIVANTSTTLTTTQQYQCVITVAAVGTTLANVVATGTATTTSGTQVINAAATNLVRSFEVNFNAPGQTLILTVTAATLTSFVLRIGQYDVSN